MLKGHYRKIRVMKIIVTVSFLLLLAASLVSGVPGRPQKGKWKATKQWPLIVHIQKVTVSKSSKFANEDYITNVNGETIYTKIKIKLI